MWQLTAEERHQLAKGGDHLDLNLQTKKQLFSIYKEESLLRKKFEEALNCYDEDDAERNASGVTQRMSQALTERRRYFSVNGANIPGKRLSLPNILSSPRSFQKPRERALSDEANFGNFPALTFRPQNDTNTSAKFEVSNIEVKEEGAPFYNEKPRSNDASVPSESPRLFVPQKHNQLQKNLYNLEESPKVTTQSSRRLRSLSFTKSSTIRHPVHPRGRRGRRIGFASSWKTRLHRRPYIVIP